MVDLRILLKDEVKSVKLFHVSNGVFGPMIIWSAKFVKLWRFEDVMVNKMNRKMMELLLAIGSKNFSP